MSNPRFDLVDVAQTLQRRSKFLLIAVIICALLGGLFYVVGKKKYKAEADFIVSNPLYSDRNNLFRTHDTRFVDYFGGDDDIDRILVIAKSDTLRHAIADNLNLWEAYDLDKTKADDRLELKEMFEKRFKMERTEYTTGKVYFKDSDAERAANVVNTSLRISENIFRGYYLKMKDNVANSLQSKINEIDNLIADNTIKLVELSDKYSALSLKDKGSAEGAMLRVKIEEISEINTQLIKDKAQHVSLQNEFLTGVNENDPNRYITVITPATPPVKPAGIGLILTVIGAAIFGFFFISIYILIITYYRRLIEVER